MLSVTWIYTYTALVWYIYFMVLVDIHIWRNQTVLCLLSPYYINPFKIYH